MTTHTILFLAANPLRTDRLALDREARAIQVELERSGRRDCFDLATRWAVEPLDLLRELRALRPTVVHFSGHGAASVAARGAGAGPRRDVVSSDRERETDPDGGLVFHAPDGRAQLVPGAVLAQAFAAAGASVRLVVLGACYSEPQAAALVAYVDCVVGMRHSIRDDAARSFAIGFYGGLGAGEPVAAAFRQGRAAIALEGLSDHELPQLAARPGIDPSRLVLSAHGSPRPRDRSAPSISAAHGSVAAGSITDSVVILGAPPTRDHDDE